MTERTYDTDDGEFVEHATLDGWRDQDERVKARHQQMADAMNAMLNLHTRMMRECNHGASNYQPETMELMNEAPSAARKAVLDAGYRLAGTDEDGWVEWTGGPRPVAKHVIIDVECANGLPRDPVAAGLWPDICWHWRPKTNPKSEWNIVKYRVVK